MSFFLFTATLLGLALLWFIGIFIAAPIIVLGLAVLIFIETDIGLWPFIFMLWSLIFLIILRTENRISDFFKSIFKK
ncbi:MAG: hypothetical protein CBC47_08750 [Alphaproteobacteria bacterium TMED87]|nr:hypothetical protein [Rhodospirillaceae bacterium]OUV07680.1 MAG: hypothetical protein CBC47_08750 [Alphaproteobacteria bacterium TMED87]|tara:strand:+ start:91 stop:321 length:231 start_codon:yes stop_codon:yes gene_type:complete